MERFMIAFGDIRQNEQLTKEWNEFVAKMMANDYWIKQFDKWDPEGRDWGWMSGSDAAATANPLLPMVVDVFMVSNGFRSGMTPWGEVRYDVANPYRVPTEIRFEGKVVGDLKKK